MPSRHPPIPIDRPTDRSIDPTRLDRSIDRSHLTGPDPRVAHLRARTTSDIRRRRRRCATRRDTRRRDARRRATMSDWADSTDLPPLSADLPSATTATATATTATGGGGGAGGSSNASARDAGGSRVGVDARREASVTDGRGGHAPVKTSGYVPPHLRNRPASSGAPPRGGGGGSFGGER